MKLWVLILSVSILVPAVCAQRTKGTEKPISLDRQNLTRLRDSQMARGIGQAFCSAITTPRLCPKCREPFSDAYRYGSLFKNPFLLVDMEANDFGGYFLLAVFKAHPKVYRLWVYEIDTGHFQLREMVPLAVTLNKELMEELGHRDYFPYWLEACPNRY